MIGWSPILKLMKINKKTGVLKVMDWVGGEGERPSLTNRYIGEGGLVRNKRDAIIIENLDKLMIQKND